MKNVKMNILLRKETSFVQILTALREIWCFLPAITYNIEQQSAMGE